MNNVAITAEIGTETLALVDQAAQARGISSAEYMAESIRRVAESDADYRAFIQVGIDAVDRGDVVSQDAVMAELDSMIARHSGRCAA